MKKILTILLISFLILPLISCSSKKKKSIKSQKTQTVSAKKNETNKIEGKADLFNDNGEPFYTVDPKLEDIESEMALLKEKVIQYESQISTPNFNTEILKLIKFAASFQINCLLFVEALTEFIPQSLTPLIINGITVVSNFIFAAKPHAATIPLSLV